MACDSNITFYYKKIFYKLNDILMKKLVPTSYPLVVCWSHMPKLSDINIMKSIRPLHLKLGAVSKQLIEI